MLHLTLQDIGGDKKNDEDGLGLGRSDKLRSWPCVEIGKM